MRTRFKIVLTIMAAIIVWWVWQVFDYDPITSDKTPVEFNSAIAAADAIPPMTTAQLKAHYRADNDEFFNSELPRNVIFDYELHDAAFEAVTSKEEDGTFRISLNPAYATSQRHTDYLVLHESCHVKTWDESLTHKNLLGDVDMHGSKWQSCMLQIDAAGGFRRLLIDNYGGA